jgi:hypothetical protein
MKIGFNPKNEITITTELFGRTKEMEFLIGYAKRRSCVQIIGPRRFGKTSLLKCLESHFNKIENTDIYPLYIDFTEVASEVVGTVNVYRYLISLVVSKISSEKLFEEPEQFRGITIKPSNYWEDTYELLKDISSSRLQEILKEVVTFFSDLIDKTFLFLFDEYEYLFKYGFDQPTGFTTLRNFSSKLNEKGKNPFVFFIAGGMTWEKLCSITKSGELNVIDQIIRVTPIQKDEFIKLWNHELSFIENPTKELIEGSDFAFKSSGGVPFYGKTIGNFWVSNNVKPSFNILQSHFNEILNSLELEQRDVLNNLIKAPASVRESENVLELKANGIILKKNNLYEHSIIFLKDYLLSIYAQPTKKVSDLPLSFALTDQITDYISNINSTCFNKGKDYIFDVLNEDESLYRDLRIPVQDRNQVVQFACSLYRILWEKTKENDINKAKLPKHFTKNNRFMNLVNIMRHTLGKGHLYEKMTIGNQMSKEEMYQMLLGTKNEPINPEDFLKIQIETLKLFLVELKKLKTIVDL